MSNEPEPGLLHPTPTQGLVLLRGTITVITASLAVCCSLSDPGPLTDNVYSNNFQFFMLMGEKSGDQMFSSVSLVRLSELPKGENKNKIYNTSAAKLPVQASHSC